MVPCEGLEPPRLSALDPLTNYGFRHINSGIGVDFVVWTLSSPYPMDLGALRKVSTLVSKVSLFN